MNFLAHGVINKAVILVILLLIHTSGNAAGGLHVEWAGPKLLNINKQSGGLSGSANNCKTGNTIHWYLIFNSIGVNTQRHFASTPGRADGLCAKDLEEMLPVSIIVEDTEIYLIGIGRTVGYMPPNGGLSITTLYGKGGSTGNGWKPPGPGPEPEPEKPTCSGQAVTLNYRDIEANKVQDREETETLSIFCTGDAFVRVYTMVDNIDLRSDDKLNASLFVAGSVGTAGHKVMVAKNIWKHIAITSKLNFTGVGNPRGGPFEGSAVIYMEIG